MFSVRGLRVIVPRSFSSGHAVHSEGYKALLAKMEIKVKAEQARVKEVKEKFGDQILGTCTVEQAYGGMRDVKSMVTETSLLDSHEGIRFRGLSIPEACAKLPRAPGSSEPLPEALLWLLLTGDVPTAAEANILVKELQHRAAVPKKVADVIDAFPKTLHPMSQLVAAVSVAQSESVFAKAYQDGVKKDTYWRYALDDSLTLIARLPSIAAHIYARSFKNRAPIPADPSLDMGANFAKMLGFEGKKNFADLVRLYLVLHSDHEGGNVSAHTTHLVGSALSDPYLSFAGGMCGLAGPLHGLANQEVLSWLEEAQAKLGQAPSNEDVEKYLWDTLKAGRVIPGYGHAVLRRTDPRFEAQERFALQHLPKDPLFKLVHQVYKIAPGVLTKHGKTKNPYPNVDAHSGCLLMHYGMTEKTFYTVMFGVSRAIGVLPSLVWDRALGLPLERPKSVTTDWIIKKFSAGSNASKDDD